MSISLGGVPGSHQSNINITPMIDVLLVLLILFLIIQPALTKGIDVQVPAEEQVDPGSDPPDQIVLHVRDGVNGPVYSVNDVAIGGEEVEDRIREIFAGRARKVLFVQGDESLPFRIVVGAMDLARGAGVEVIGLAPRPAAAP